MEFNYTSNNSRILRLPFIDDIPRAFLDIDRKNFIAGPYGQLILNFGYYKKFKLQFELVNSTKWEIYHIINGTYNLSLHGGVYSVGNETLRFGYPIESYETCIVVPLEDELPKFYYIVWAIGPYIWLALAVIMVYAAILLHLMERPYHRRSAAQSIPRNILNTGAVLLNCSNMNVQLVNADVRHKIFYFLLIVLAFIISAFHLSHMTAFCMKPIFRDPIDTVTQLLDEKLNIIVPDNTLDELRESQGYDKLEHLEKYMQVVNQNDFIPLVKGLSRSYAYMLTQDQWDFLYRQQRYLRKPYFHRSKMCYQKRLMSFPMRMDLNEENDLHIFQLRVHQAGLWIYWTNEGFRRAVHAGYAEVLSDIYPVLPLDMYFFRFGWITIISGLTLSCCAMLIELIIWTCMSRRKTYDDLFLRRRYERFT